jgi:hypothetical protein
MVGVVVLLVTWLVLAGVVAYVASQRGRSVVGLFFLSLLLSPLVGFLVAIGLPVREPVSAQERARRERQQMAFAEWFGWSMVAVSLVVIGWVVVWVR